MRAQSRKAVGRGAGVVPGKDRDKFGVYSIINLQQLDLKMTFEDFDDLRLTPTELALLLYFWCNRREGWLPLHGGDDDLTDKVDMLVLSGLVERQGGPGAWEDRWRLTEDGDLAVQAMPN